VHFSDPAKFVKLATSVTPFCARVVVYDNDDDDDGDGFTQYKYNSNACVRTPARIASPSPVGGSNL